MGNTYAQVFATYYRRLQFLVVTAVLCVIVLSWLGFTTYLRRNYAVSAENWQSEFLIMRFVGVTLTTVMLGWMAGMIMGHVKEQLADWRARLWPGFRTPHVIVASAILLATTIVIPAALSVLLRASPTGFIAVVLWAAAGWAWTMHLQTPWIVAIWIGSWATPAVPRFQNALTAMMNGQAAGISWAMIAIGVAAFVGLFARLAFMHEEMAEYFRQGVDPKSQLRPQMTGDPTQVRIGRISASGWNISLLGADWMMNRVRNIRDTGIFAQARHWRLALGTASAPWVVASLMMLAALIFVPRDNQHDVEVFVCVILMWSILPTMVQAPFWPARWPTLGYELTRPIDRRRFVRVMFASFALDVLASVVAFVTIGFIGMATCWPGALQPAIKALLVPITLQALMYAGAIWILRFRSIWISILGLQLAMAAPLFMLIPSVDRPDKLSMNWILVRATIFIMAAVVVGFDAYRRWLQTDFD